MTSALRWAAMRAILMFHSCEGQSHKIVSRDHNFWRERRADADSNQGPSAYQPNTLLLGQTGSHMYINMWVYIFWYTHKTRKHIQVYVERHPRQQPCFLQSANTVSIHNQHTHKSWASKKWGCALWRTPRASKVAKQKTEWLIKLVRQHAYLEIWPKQTRV